MKAIFISFIISLLFVSSPKEPTLVITEPFYFDQNTVGEIKIKVDTFDLFIIIPIEINVVDTTCLKRKKI